MAYITKRDRKIIMDAITTLSMLKVEGKLTEDGEVLINRLSRLYSRAEVGALIAKTKARETMRNTRARRKGVKENDSDIEGVQS